MENRSEVRSPSLRARLRAAVPGALRESLHLDAPRVDSLRRVRRLPTSSRLLHAHGAPLPGGETLRSPPPGTFGNGLLCFRDRSLGDVLLPRTPSRARSRATALRLLRGVPKLGRGLSESVQFLYATRSRLSIFPSYLQWLRTICDWHENCISARHRDVKESFGRHRIRRSLGDPRARRPALPTGVRSCRSPHGGRLPRSAARVAPSERDPRPLRLSTRHRGSSVGD